MNSKGFFLAALVALFVAPVANAQLSVDASLIDFGTVPVGSTMSSLVTVVNDGVSGLPADLGVIELEGDFTYATNCPATLMPSDFCQIQVSFTPLEAGKHKRHLEIKYYVNGKKDEIKVRVMGITPKIVTPKQLSFDRSAVDFGSVSVGSISTALVTLTNNGLSGALADIREIELKGDFSTTTNCPATLAPGDFCQIQITFAPVAPGTHKRSLEVEYRANGIKEEIEVDVLGKSFAQ